MHTGIYYKLITPFKSTKNNKYNYVYQITELSTGKKYIGSRGSTIEPNKDIKNYKSSSKDKQFKLNQKLNPLNYWYEILSYHETREDANIEESRLHELYNVSRSNNYFNRCKQTKHGFSTAGKITVVDKNGNVMQVSNTDDRYLNGELKFIASGTVLVKDKNGVIIRVSIDDDRFLSGDLKHIASGTVPVKDKNGVIIRVSIDDERFLNGDLKHISSGKIAVKDKDGKIMHISNTDERFLSGELQHVCSGKITVKDKNGVTMQVSIDDERYLNGDLIGVKAKWLTIEGETMSSTIAAKRYKVTSSTVCNRVKSTNPKWNDWKFM